MDIKLTEKCFKGMYGAYAAMFTPYDKKGRVNPEMIEQIIEAGLYAPSARNEQAAIDRYDQQEAEGTLREPDQPVK